MSETHRIDPMACRGVSGSSAPPGSASQAFRFRFVARGEPTNTLVSLAIHSLKQCHPHVSIVLIDANDAPTLDRSRFCVPGEFEVVHIKPEQDAIARAFGRGTRSHLFYWRHSPQLLKTLPRSNRFDVHSDADIVFVRPFDLRSLLGPLEQGRIAATVDESTLDYYQAAQAFATTGTPTVFPAGVSGGPLLQGGLIFSNPADDGELYKMFWARSVEAATTGELSLLPWDDMGILSSLLAQGGPLWERLLVLGHEWNFITDASKDLGVFGRAAHYGGRRAQALLLEHQDVFLPLGQSKESGWWGRVGKAGGPAVPLLSGGWSPLPDFNSGEAGGPLAVSVALPCSVTWKVPAGAAQVELSAHFLSSEGVEQPRLLDGTAYVYIDGRFYRRYRFNDGRFRAAIPSEGSETITVIIVSPAPNSRVRFDHIFHGRPDGEDRLFYESQ